MSKNKDLPDLANRAELKSFIEVKQLMPDHTKDIHHIIEEHPMFFAVIAALLVMEFDLITGEEIEFPVLFAIPVALAAWGLMPFMAYGLSIALPLLRVGFVLFFWDRSQALHVLVINAIITITALIGYAYLIIKISLEKRRLEDKVKTLEEKHNNW